MIKTDFERKNGKVIVDCLYLVPRYSCAAVAEIDGKYYKADACPGFKDRLTPLPYYYDPLPEWQVKVKRWYFVYGLCPRLTEPCEGHTGCKCSGCRELLRRMD